VAQKCYKNDTKWGTYAIFTVGKMHAFEVDLRVINKDWSSKPVDDVNRGQEWKKAQDRTNIDQRYRGGSG